MSNISARLAQELNAKEQQVIAATALLDEGATVRLVDRLPGRGGVVGDSN